MAQDLHKIGPIDILPGEEKGGLKGTLQDLQVGNGNSRAGDHEALHFLENIWHLIVSGRGRDIFCSSVAIGNCKSPVSNPNETHWVIKNKQIGAEEKKKHEWEENRRK